MRDGNVVTVTDDGERCSKCGGHIPRPEVEFDLSGGRIGLPQHRKCPPTFQQRHYRPNGANMYDALDEVPWNTVPWVTGPSGHSVGIDADGFAVWLTGSRSGQRIPLDAHGPWQAAPGPSPEVLEAVKILTDKGIDGAMYEKLIAQSGFKVRP